MLFSTLVSVSAVAAVIVGLAVLEELAAKLGLALCTYLLTLVTGIILGPLWEEPGWRRFALPWLQDRFGPLAGSLVLGVVWTIWHAPGFLGWVAGGISAAAAGVGHGLLGGHDLGIQQHPRKQPDRRRMRCSNCQNW